MGLMQEFKSWITKGSLIEIAIGLILAITFAALVESFIKNLVTPILGAIGGTPDFNGLNFKLNGSVFHYGAFLNSLITFLLTGFVLFLVAKAAMKMMKAQAAEPDAHLEVLKAIEAKIGL